eukprot:TRINITY_DN5189_c0_g5_i1.p1 TRINITY_DN5189_c0_g5~~TRINITY_DN5189_c0_g5_i1.p1  ORF type:complete len:295 (+),score=-0.86 TRINITY_DN5189_c0_g5_i1:149-1033(+)
MFQAHRSNENDNLILYECSVHMYTSHSGKYTPDIHTWTDARMEHWPRCPKRSRHFSYFCNHVSQVTEECHSSERKVIDAETMPKAHIFQARGPSKGSRPGGGTQCEFTGPARFPLNVPIVLPSFRWFSLAFRCYAHESTPPPLFEIFPIGTNKLAHLEVRENMLHASLLGDWTIWFVVSGWIVRCFAYLHLLYNAIFDNEHEAFASRVAKGVQGTRVVHAHSDCLGEFTPRVGQECDDGTLHTLILCPRLHHCTVVHAVNQHLVNSLLLQLSLLGQVARHLHRRSAGSEGAGQA